MYLTIIMHDAMAREAFKFIVSNFTPFKGDTTDARDKLIIHFDEDQHDEAIQLAYQICFATNVDGPAHYRITVVEDDGRHHGV